MPSPTTFQPVPLDIPKPPRKPGRPNKNRAKQGAKPKTPITLKAQVSQETYDRLIAEAMTHQAFDGMGPDELRAYVNARLDEFMTPYPRWAGHLAADKPRKPTTEAQHQALRKARQRKRDIQAEGEAPYVIQCERDIPHHGADE